MPIDLDSNIKAHHLAPLGSALIVIAMYLGRSENLLSTLFLLNLLALPFLTGIMYVSSLDSSEQPSWIRVVLGPWPVIGLVLLVDLLLGSIYFLFMAPILLAMASLGSIISRYISLKRTPTES
ncbi:MAG TPA: hypothetical protein VN643_00925 [Pyrinomonadaceae bacterium]|nr:hypothetical protein [Pyrinomonadaceae bacterium]